MNFTKKQKKEIINLCHEILFELAEFKKEIHEFCKPIKIDLDK